MNIVYFTTLNFLVIIPFICPLDPSDFPFSLFAKHTTTKPKITKFQSPAKSEAERSEAEPARTLPLWLKMKTVNMKMLKQL